MIRRLKPWGRLTKVWSYPFGRSHAASFRLQTNSVDAHRDLSAQNCFTVRSLLFCSSTIRDHFSRAAGDLLMPVIFATRLVTARCVLCIAHRVSLTVNRLGHISHEGPSTVRHLITEAARHGARLSPTIRAYFERITQGSRERRKIALVATGHYLLRVMHAMLRDGTPWKEIEPAALKAAA